MGICAGSYYGSRKVEFDLHGPLEVNEERELKLFKGRAVGPAYKGFDYKSTKGEYAIPFVFNEETPVYKDREWIINRKEKYNVKELVIIKEVPISYGSCPYYNS